VNTPSLVEQVGKHLQEAELANRNGAHETSRFEIQLAKVKAQLAAVEQQRIANLIALKARVVSSADGSGMYSLREVMPNDAIDVALGTFK